METSSAEIAGELLEWNEMLVKRADNSRSTPLHYAALVGNDKMVELLLQKDTSLAYIVDSSAAIMGKVSAIDELFKHCPDSDELLDNKGRNLLYTAVEHKRLVIVRNVCRRSELMKLMNARDYEGNTPLHLAVRKREQEIVSLLIENKRVNLNARNKEGRTPLDLSVIRLERGLAYFMNPSNWILRCLIKTGARLTPSVDLFMRNNVILDSEKESKKYLQMNQSLIITSVLITTLTFSAAFTLPGGYNTDGTPNLAGSYTFKAFVIADILAFMFSVFSTFWNTLGGSEGMHPKLRDYFVIPSYDLVLWATRSLVAAFVLGIYLVLAPINNSFGIVVCVITSIVPLFLDTPTMMQVYKLAITTKSRVGWNGLYKSHANPHVNYSFNVAHYIIRRMLGVSWIYVIIFMLPLILEKI